MPLFFPLELAVTTLLERINAQKERKSKNFRNFVVLSGRNPMIKKSVKFLSSLDRNRQIIE